MIMYTADYKQLSSATASAINYSDSASAIIPTQTQVNQAIPTSLPTLSISLLDPWPPSNTDPSYMGNRIVMVTGLGIVILWLVYSYSLRHYLLYLSKSKQPYSILQLV